MVLGLLGVHGFVAAVLPAPPSHSPGTRSIWKAASSARPSSTGTAIPNVRCFRRTRRLQTMQGVATENLGLDGMSPPLCDLSHILGYARELGVLSQKRPSAR